MKMAKVVSFDEAKVEEKGKYGFGNCEEELIERNRNSISGWNALGIVGTFNHEWPSVDLVEPGRLVCSMKMPPRLLNSNNSLDALVDVVGAAAIPNPMSSGVSMEINVSYFDAAYVDEEIEIDARTLRVGKAVAVVSVEFRKKKTSQIFAEGRHTKFLAVASKL